MDWNAFMDRSVDEVNALSRQIPDSAKAFKAFDTSGRE